MKNISFCGVTLKCLNIDDQSKETLIQLSPEKYFMIIVIVIIQIHTYFGGHFECVYSSDCYCSTISRVDRRWLLLICWSTLVYILTIECIHCQACPNLGGQHHSPSKRWWVNTFVDTTDMICLRGRMYPKGSSDWPITPSDKRGPACCYAIYLHNITW